MEAVIMAAGKGKRISKFDPSTPKALLKIRNKPLIKYLLDNLIGIAEKIIIVIGFLGDRIKKEIGDNYKGTPIVYVKQKKIDGTSRALFTVKDLVSDSFIVLTSDCYYTKKDIKKCSKYELCILAKEPNPMKKGGMILNPDNSLKIILEKKSRKNLCNAGLYKLNKKIFSYPLIKSERGEYEITDLINKIAEDFKVNVIKTKTWAHISYASDILTLTNFLDGYGIKKKEFSNVLFKKEDKLLLQLRSNEVWLPFRNLWQFIGGMVEKNETPLGCAIREIKEELNINLKKKDLKYITTIYSNNREDFIFICTKEIDYKKVILREGEEIRFIKINNIKKLRLVPADKNIAKNIQKIIN